MDDMKLALEIARAVKRAGGRAFIVGGYVRDKLLGIGGKDVDLEIFGITPKTLRGLLSEMGEVYDKGASFGVLGLRHSEIDIAMPRRESRTGARHADFDVAVDPFMTPREASARRDFTMNAMMLDPLTGEIIDEWGGRADLEKRVIRHVSDETFIDDALRAFRAAQFSARLNAQIAPETLKICADMDVSLISKERVLDETAKALLKADAPSEYFRALERMGHLGEFFTELKNCVGIKQNPEYHPEGDVFVHTMLVLDAAARLRRRAKEPLNFMLAAVCHDLGKVTATEVIDGRISSHMHHITGVALTESLLMRITTNSRTIAYVKNMVFQHMRPNMLAGSKSKKKKTRALFDESICPEDLILLSRADAEGKLGAPYDENNEIFLNERLADYRECVKRPMVTGADLIKAGYTPGKKMGELVKRGRELHFSGLEKKRALRQILSESPPRAEDK